MKVVLVYLFRHSFLFYPRSQGNVPSDNFTQLVYSLGFKLAEVALHGFNGLLFEFELGPLSDLGSATFLGSFRLPSIVLGLDVSVEGGI